ncbi:MAG: aminotransferase class III-fold pyridoxal phosphate-dependent enzyme [Proteobacteria bacterium]|nr:aminotransferase class III-fold pyridoxal phosphate-dependent enzyme [Pseudomonadota bacterium]
MSAAHDALRAANARHMFHPMVDPKVARANPPLIIERGQGVHVWDIDGKRYLDTVAALWNVNVGHDRPELKRAVAEQLDKLAYYSTFQNTSNPPAIELSARLARMFAPEKMTQVLFSSGGSDAVEGALKLARQYWQLEGRAGRTKFISLKLGYHGVHFGGASVNGNPAFRAAYEPLLPGCFQIESPYLYRNPWGESDPAHLAQRCADELDRAIQYQGADTVAAFIAEPVQGAGGVIVPHESYWPLVRAVCDKHGVLLISDEIVTGFGRIGAMCGARAWGVAPDIMAMAKGINSGIVPLGATLINERVADAYYRPEAQAAVMHGYTYSGHALACATANANLEIVEGENLAGRSLEVGAYLAERLEEFRRYPQVGDVRGKGLMAAIELVVDRATKEPLVAPAPFVPALIATARREGAIVRIQGNRLILSPPLVFSRADVDETARILHAAFDAAGRASL